ncbi:AAA family ATPase [Polaribacter haliotis]|uniref:AAA family ATPase n=1 Tax=Polaribacter haliotis TaxID=1888915 RepID=A0A7L8AJJ4_9FLAO|nr:AAA family ATPase [Polaribacter haliotis]QOD62172.1 AAA family ATPase [Polaribacter haliotis]
MKIENFKKELFDSNLGTAGMHDRYITIPKKAKPELFFGKPPRAITLKDKCFGVEYKLPFKHESNGEYRLTQLGVFFDKHNAKVGDEIFVENSDSGDFSISLIRNSNSSRFMDFVCDCINHNLNFTSELITRYVSSLTTKPFVLLSGLSGSGKTKLAQSFAQWISDSTEQYCIVPVGADWTNREPLLGYVNALEPEKYILPENKALELLIKANKDENKPYFLILDEMNLSHVERYFADFLSVMESKDKFKLHSSNKPLDGGNGLKVKREYGWPKNLFVVGTVNIDETTYMFSPKVLDRANVIEFRIGENEMKDYLSEPRTVTDLNREGKGMGESFVSIAKEESKANPQELKDALEAFFKALKVVGAEFGYRTASEIQTLFSKIDTINPEYISKINDKIDFAIMQKLLPKLHGSRSKLVPILKTLASLCYEVESDKKLTEKEIEKNIDTIFERKGKEKKVIKYPISLEKIERMYNNVITNGFTSYAEA